MAPSLRTGPLPGLVGYQPGKHRQTPSAKVRPPQPQPEDRSLAKLPRITGTELLRALRAAGWQEARQRGSHVILRHAERPDRRIVVPVHAGRTLKAGTLTAILREAGLTVDELVRLL